MNNFAKFALAATLVGATALATAAPSEARSGRNTAAAIGFGAGALVGAAVASSANSGYYGNRYYGGRYYQEGYAYDPGYTYEPDSYAPDSYAYEPAPAYSYGSQRRYYRSITPQCGGSPGSVNYVPCGNN